MEEVIPLFKSHYSLGRSILTLDIPKEFTDDRSDTVFDIIDDITPELKDVFLVEDSMAGFLEAYTNAKELKKKLIFGLRLTFCPDCLKKNEEGRKNSYKNIIFIKNEAGYKQLIKIYTYAAQDGFYYEPRLDFKKLKEFWTDDLILGIPFYDSFLYNNKYTDSQCIPDFSFNNPVFLIEDNDTLLDKDMGKAVEKFCEGKYETVKAQSVYYRRNEDFEAYVTARCIGKRTTTEKPNLEGMCSDQFSIEAWCKKTGSKITGKPRRAIEEKEIIEAPAIITKLLKEKPHWDQDTPRGQASIILERATNRFISNRNGLRIDTPTYKGAKHDGDIYDKDGDRIGHCENKVRPFVRDDTPFCERHLYEYGSGDKGWMITAKKVDNLFELTKKGHGFSSGHLMIPYERKIFLVNLYSKTGTKLWHGERKWRKMWKNVNKTEKKEEEVIFIDMKKTPVVSFTYEYDDLSTHPIPLSEECVKFSGLTHMSEKEAHDNLLAHNEWPWNNVKYIK